MKYLLDIRFGNELYGKMAPCDFKILSRQLKFFIGKSRACTGKHTCFPVCSYTNNNTCSTRKAMYVCDDDAYGTS